MNDRSLSRRTYSSRNVGEYPAGIEVMGQAYTKVADLRYGTNPHQTAAHYTPVGLRGVIGQMEVLKTGKGGLSQTNLEDISYALNIVKFFSKPACVCMKHVNPSGAAVGEPGGDITDVYVKARDCDARAAFGSTVAFNCEVTPAVAREIMTSFVECVVAPHFAPDAIGEFHDSSTHGLNKHLRVLQCGSLADLPKYTGDDVAGYQTFKTLADGSLVVADPILTSVRSVVDLVRAQGCNKADGEQVSTVEPSAQQLEDLLTAWYVNISVRSNGVVLVKNGGTLAVGTGEQDRVGAVEQALLKYTKYKGPESLEGAAMASDGFFPFPDSVEVAAEAGVRAIVAPPGSLRDATVIKRANELGVALRFAPERIFSHH